MAHERKHGSESFFIEGEGLLVTQLGGREGGEPDPLDAEEGPTSITARPLAAGEVPGFRFTRVGPKSRPLRQTLLRKVAEAMVGGPQGPAGGIPAGYTYLGQFIDHDLTMDRTQVMLGDEVTPADMLQGRSPGLDLDSLYGAGPGDDSSERFYKPDGLHLKVGRSSSFNGPGLPDRDLPRVGTGGRARRRRALIADPRNDENLAVAQTHVAMLNFHNRVVDRQPAATRALPAGRRFRMARKRVTLHYQWMVRHDYLPRICDPAVLDDVWTGGRRLVQPDADAMTVPAMPIEFSVAAFRVGHSMVRRDYNWNSQFPGRAGSLRQLFTFSGLGGNLGGDDRLVDIWIVDWRRLYDFPAAGKPRLKGPGRLNQALRIDTRLTDVLGALPPSTFGGGRKVPPLARNLAFRNLDRAGMVGLATGQQMVERLRDRGVRIRPLTRRQILQGNRGVDLDGLTKAEKDALVTRTPLWFYVLREAELNDGVLTGVGARIVAETFHRAIEGSRFSILRNEKFRPTLGARKGTFEMTDLLQFTYGSTRKGLAPAG